MALSIFKNFRGVKAVYPFTFEHNSGPCDVEVHRLCWRKDSVGQNMRGRSVNIL